MHSRPAYEKHFSPIVERFGADTLSKAVYPSAAGWGYGQRCCLQPLP
jgi:hypothetical protein